MMRFSVGRWRSSIIAICSLSDAYNATKAPLKVIGRLFSYQPLYQARALITAICRRVAEAVVDRGLDMEANMRTAA